jgi:hypothetical protein
MFSHYAVFFEFLFFPLLSPPLYKYLFIDMAPKRAASVTVPEDQVVLQEQRDDSSTDDQAPDQVMNNRYKRSAHTYSPLLLPKAFLYRG